MQSRGIRLASIALGSCLGLLLSLAASAEGLVLRPRYEVGDQFALSLVTVTKTDLRSSALTSGARRASVEFRYTATVEVIETAADGSPVRERHHGVELTSPRRDGSGSLFAKGASIEVLRDDAGSLQVFHQGARVDRKIEKIVADLLSQQFAYGVGALVDPGRAVALGETWQLAPERVEAFLRARGLRAIELGGPATASVAAGESERLTVRYRIPIEAFALDETPSNLRPGRSSGSLEGEVQLDPNGAQHLTVHSSSLALNLKGAMDGTGASHRSLWSLHRSQSVDEHAESIQDQLASRD
jgi:hypothetical protein